MPSPPVFTQAPGQENLGALKVKGLEERRCQPSRS